MFSVTVVKKTMWLRPKTQLRVNNNMKPSIVSAGVVHYDDLILSVTLLSVNEVI